MKYSCSEKIVENYFVNFLKKRGIEDHEAYLAPSREKNLLNPHNLDNIEEAAWTILQYCSDPNNKIVLIVDCDQDGYTSAAMIYNYLQKYYNNKCNFILKFHSGKQHGLEDTIDEIEAEGAELVIIPDAGSDDYIYHKRLCDIGARTVVIDHHESEGYSEYATVVNNQLSKNYSNKSLSGAGVVYKLLQVLDEMLGIEEADNYLDLAAVGIIGDMMEINNLENRYIIYNGLRNIQNECIKEIINKQAFSIKDTDNITPEKVSFFITPLVNALIRVGKMSEKEILFRAFVNGREMIPKISRGKVVEGRYESVAEQNARNCTNARSRQNRTLDKALDMAIMDISKNGLDENKIIFYEVDDGIVDSVLTGLLAMQICAFYNKPTVIVREGNNGFLKGSARGNDKGILKNLRQFFLDSGYFDFVKGHANAHGVSIEKTKVNSFLNYSNKLLSETDFDEGVYDVDFILSHDEDVIKELIFTFGDCPELYGKGCEEPEMVIENIPLKASEISVIGKDANTVKFTHNGITYIQFSAKNLIEDLQGKEDISITVLGKPNVNTWMNYQTPQIIIKDYEIHNRIFEF
jgi:single-stranded-DNA-specific exonuclease